MEFEGKNRDGNGAGLGWVDQKPDPPQKTAGWKMTPTPASTGGKLHPHPEGFGAGFGFPRALAEK
jgi:hypothetical protein